MFAPRLFRSLLASCAVLAFAWAPPAGADDAPQHQAAAAPGAWTLDDALAHLAIYPHDSYAQFVAVILARNEGRDQLERVFNTIQRNQWGRNRFNRRNEEVELYGLFSGKLAVQESLQLDAMTAQITEDFQAIEARPGRQGPGPIGGQPPRRIARQVEDVPIASLQGPTIKSHPWREMLADKSPAVTGLALKVPEDFFFIRFRSASKLLEAQGLVDTWGAYVSSQADQASQTQLTSQRLLTQLAVEVHDYLRPLYDTGVEEVAIVGSDLFVREGADVTLLFQMKQEQAFRMAMDHMLENAAQSVPSVKRSAGAYQGIEYAELVSPDRTVHVYSAYPGAGLHVRSNSLPALKQVLDVVLGHNEQGAAVNSLGQSEEFRYVRTLLPEGAVEEDGLVYLSDPFVRRLMSAEVRITERRRMVCYNHLRMIGHAALLQRTQTGVVPTDLAELKENGFAPGEFGAGRLECPEHGTYSLAADGLTGVCSHHGYPGSLTPCLDAPSQVVTPSEALAYGQFVEEYSRFWQQFFDPIAIRVQLKPERIRVETLVLPLIDNSIYSNLAMALGGEPEPLDALPVPRRNIFSVGVRLNKQRLLHELGLDKYLEVDEKTRAQWEAEAQSEEVAAAMRNIMLATLNHESMKTGFPAPAKNELSWRVQILPFLEQKELYDKFRQDEPWDSPHNSQMIKELPEIFRPTNEQLAAEGKTKFVVPRGAGTLYAKPDKAVPLRLVRDGTSNTIALVEIDDPHAVVWTKPDDVELPPDQLFKVLQRRMDGEALVAFADSHLEFLKEDLDPATFVSMLTPAGGEIVVRPDAVDRRRFARRTPRLNQREEELVARLRLGETISQGVGNQIALHLCDGDPLIDVAIPRFLGTTLGSLRGRGWMDEELLLVLPMLSALNGPVYVSIPVQDAGVVDRFLASLDEYLAEEATRDERNWFFSINKDFYKLPSTATRQPVRVFGIAFGPVKWRFFWTRIDNAVYIASKQHVLDDLYAAATSIQARSNSAAEDVGLAPAHAFARLRPENWDEVLASYRLGWEENQRQACQANLGPLAALQRAVVSQASAGVENAIALQEFAERVYGVRYFCPDGGAYKAAGDGHDMSCSVHGTVHAPRQVDAPAPRSALMRELSGFQGLTVQLTFLEDGLRAVATIDRSPTAAVGAYWLNAPRAKTAGSCRLIPRKGVIGFWGGVDATVAWPEQRIPRGRYRVDVEYASPFRGGARINFGEQSVLLRVAPTGGWTSFVRRSAGKVEIDSVPTDVKVSTIEIEGDALMDLKSIVLVPLDAN